MLLKFLDETKLDGTANIQEDRNKFKTIWRG